MLPNLPDQEPLRFYRCKFLRNFHRFATLHYTNMMAIPKKTTFPRVEARETAPTPSFWPNVGSEYRTRKFPSSLSQISFFIAIGPL